MGDMFHNLNVMNKALDASMLRNNIISNNIANEETPGFKRQDVNFQTILASEIKNKGKSGIDVNALDGKVYTDRASFSGRLDGNNVDIDQEMSELAKNKLRYDTLTRRASAQIQRFKTILQNLK
ncbi:MAG: flagellar basal body rod protein FlgB [Cellulosilyticaceae bacterium]